MTQTSGTATLRQQLHETFTAGAYDNWRVWAGAVSIEIDGLRFAPTLARAYRRGGVAPMARVRCELFAADVDATLVRSDDLRGRVGTDMAETAWVPMHLRCDASGVAELCGGNFVLESEEFPLQHTGAFTYSVEVGARGHQIGEAPQSQWVPINDIASNPPGVIVVSPGWVAQAPTITEVCLRKVDAQVSAGAFTSGRIGHMTARLEQVCTDVVYLLPFFLPGFFDRGTGKDVRKGTLGSVYAVADFYQIDPQLITPPEVVDLAALAAEDLLRQADIADVWSRVASEQGPVDAPAVDAPGADPPSLQDLLDAGGRAAASRWGRERVLQLVGRAELRQLCRRAHDLGKRVIFDLVLMQTSRDAALISEHPEWYVLDDNGEPQIHRIAWLVYSDVALLDLRGNVPLQDYLVEVAPYWMACCDLDGVRLDASQTVERAFLRRLKNRIQRQHPDALILGETLCPLSEAVDIPVDMIYALLVDFHRDAEQAGQLIEFLEEVHGTFAAGTVAMAYFENHDSPRATQVWQQRYSNALDNDQHLARGWRRRTDDTPGIALASWMALLKNLQATLINATAGMWPAAADTAGIERPDPAGGTQLAWGIEWGSQWGETARTDFENETLLNPAAATQLPGARLRAAYDKLSADLRNWRQVRRGQIYYHRNTGEGGDAEDRVLSYTRYDDDGALLAVHNLDTRRVRWVTISLDWLPWSPATSESVFDSYQALGLAGGEAGTDCTRQNTPQGLRIGVAPLQTRLFRLASGASSTRKD